MLLWDKQCVGWITALSSAEPVTSPLAVGIIWGRTLYSKDGPALQWGITNEQGNEESISRRVMLITFTVLQNY